MKTNSRHYIRGKRSGYREAKEEAQLEIQELNTSHQKLLKATAKTGYKKGYNKGIDDKSNLLDIAVHLTAHFLFIFHSADRINMCISFVKDTRIRNRTIIGEKTRLKDALERTVEVFIKRDIDTEGAIQEHIDNGWLLHRELVRFEASIEQQDANKTADALKEMQPYLETLAYFTAEDVEATLKQIDFGGNDDIEPITRICDIAYEHRNNQLTWRETWDTMRDTYYAIPKMTDEQREEDSQMEKWAMTSEGELNDEKGCDLMARTCRRRWERDGYDTSGHRT